MAAQTVTAQGFKLVSRVDLTSANLDNLGVDAPIAAYSMRGVAVTLAETSAKIAELKAVEESLKTQLLKEAGAVETIDLEGGTTVSLKSRTCYSYSNALAADERAIKARKKAEERDGTATVKSVTDYVSVRLGK